MESELRSCSPSLHKIDWASIPQRRMEPHAIVEDFNVFEDGRPGLCSGGIPLAIHLFDFEGMKKRLGHGIVVAMPRATHALNEALFLQVTAKRHTGILTTTVRVKNYPPVQAGCDDRPYQMPAGPAP